MEILKSKKQFNEIINNQHTVALFTADWCPDCRVIEPILPEIEEAYPNYTFIFIDRDEFIELCQDYNVFGIPSFIVFKNGRETNRFVSKERKTKAEIIAFLDGLSD